jgi:gliding motility-associated-like protein
LTQPTPTADITPIGLTITGISADNKVYDRTTTATLSTGSGVLVGVLTGDAVTLNSSGARGYFADRNIGTAKTVSTTLFTLDGADAGNYTLTQPDLIANITKASLEITGVTVNDKVYDGTSVATLNTVNALLAGVFGSDVVNLFSTTATPAFQDKNAGTGKPVSFTGFAIEGPDALNYTFLQPALTGNILPKAATITALDRAKTFGTELTFAGTEFKVTGLVNGDAVTGITISSQGASALATTGAYAILAAGASDSNYTFTYVNGVLTVSTAEQVITFVPIPEGLRMTQHYELEATSSSGLPVTFVVSDPNIASLNGNILTINQDGDFTVTASQEGDENWNPASSVSQSVVAAPTFDNITSLFTPNNDGINDYWYIPDLLKYGKLQVTVYNRYGQAVYKSDSYKNDWDGTWNGNPLPSATYYYIIKSSERGVLKGVVNIVR